METDSSSKSLDQQRDLTDKSLVSERGKSDDSFAAQRRKTENKTNVKVKDNRLKADRSRTASRNDIDAQTQITRRSKGHQAPHATAQQKAVDLDIETQRKSDDLAVENERQLMDEALINERKILKAEINKHLEAERKATDQNLSHERTRTDEDAKYALGVLTREQTSHSATKAQLTTRDEFLAIVSHDLRNPIGSILSYADLVLSEGIDKNPELKQWIETIKRNAQTSLRLIGDILDMERFAEGKLLVQFASVDFGKIIDETNEAFQSMAGERNITLSVDQPRPIGVIHVDGERLRQVLMNLIGNALKYTPKGGKVRVIAETIDSELKVSVEDTGIGIPQEKRQQIFERFAQIQNKDRSGLGLGLYIAAMFIEAHNGKIGVESNKPAGSRFTFTVPLAQDH